VDHSLSCLSLVTLLYLQEFSYTQKGHCKGPCLQGYQHTFLWGKKCTWQHLMIDVVRVLIDIKSFWFYHNAIVQQMTNKTNYDPQNTRYKNKDWAGSWIPQKIGSGLMRPGRVSSSYSTMLLVKGIRYFHTSPEVVNVTVSLQQYFDRW
jgi:hypothetical protein